MVHFFLYILFCVKGCRSSKKDKKIKIYMVYLVIYCNFFCLCAHLLVTQTHHSNNPQIIYLAQRHGGDSLCIFNAVHNSLIFLYFVSLLLLFCFSFFSLFILHLPLRFFYSFSFAFYSYRLPFSTLFFFRLRKGRRGRKNERQKIKILQRNNSSFLWIHEVEKEYIVDIKKTQLLSLELDTFADVTRLMLLNNTNTSFYINVEIYNYSKVSQQSANFSSNNISQTQQYILN